MHSFWSILAASAGAAPLAAPTGRRTSTSLTAPPLTTTSSLFFGVLAQNGSLWRARASIFGAAPSKAILPVMVAVPGLSDAAVGVVGLVGSPVVGVGVEPVPLGDGLGSSLLLHA